MDFVNETAHPARLFTGVIGENVKGAWVALRATYQWDPVTATLHAAPEPWPVFTTPVRTEIGDFPPDDYPYRRGCELVVVGTARTARPVTALPVSVRVGSFRDELAVRGDRVWVRGPNGLFPSEPVPFTEMPMLGWGRSYGGAPTNDEGLTLTHPLNPAGAGFYLTEAAAEGRPLPNIEDPRAPITRWDDRPTPAGWGPLDNTPVWQMTEWVRARTAGGDTPSREEIAAAGLKTFPAAASPRTLMPGLEGGELVSLSGFTERDLQFNVPVLRLRVRAQVGEETIVRPLGYTGLWVLVPYHLVVVTLRARFKYRLRPGELRAARVERDADLSG